MAGEEDYRAEPSQIRLTAAKGYAIFKVVLTATGETYVKEWADQYGTAATVDGTTATWEGDTDVLLLTNLATSQARIKTIAVTYVDTDIVDAIGAPAVETADETGHRQGHTIVNLAGQRMAGTQGQSPALLKGIYIIDGKKVLK